MFGSYLHMLYRCFINLLWKTQAIVNSHCKISKLAFYSKLLTLFESKLGYFLVNFLIFCKDIDIKQKSSLVEIGEGEIWNFLSKTANGNYTEISKHA